MKNLLQHFQKCKAEFTKCPDCLRENKSDSKLGQLFPLTSPG